MPDVSSISCNSIKKAKTDSISSENLYSNMPEDISFIKESKEMKLNDNNDFIKSKNENELEDYYDNFYK